jgi:hypothetical protein
MITPRALAQGLFGAGIGGLLSGFVDFGTGGHHATPQKAGAAGARRFYS